MEKQQCERVVMNTIYLAGGGARDCKGERQSRSGQREFSHKIPYGYEGGNEKKSTYTSSYMTM